MGYKMESGDESWIIDKNHTWGAVGLLMIYRFRDLNGINNTYTGYLMIHNPSTICRQIFNQQKKNNQYINIYIWIFNGITYTKFSGQFFLFMYMVLVPRDSQSRSALTASPLPEIFPSTPQVSDSTKAPPKWQCPPVRRKRASYRM